MASIVFEWWYLRNWSKQHHALSPKNLIEIGASMGVHRNFPAGATRGIKRGNNSSGAESLRGRRKFPTMSQYTFFNMLPKDLGFKHGGTRLVSCPGRYLTSLRLCGQRRNFAYPFQVADDAMLIDIHKSLYPFYPISLCWLTLNSPYSFEMFPTLRLSEIYFFIFLNCLISIFRALSTNKAKFKNNQRPEQHERWKNKKVRHSPKTVASNEK